PLARNRETPHIRTWAPGNHVPCPVERSSASMYLSRTLVQCCVPDNIGHLSQIQGLANLGSRFELVDLEAISLLSPFPQKLKSNLPVTGPFPYVGGKRR